MIRSYSILAIVGLVGCSNPSVNNETVETLTMELSKSQEHKDTREKLSLKGSQEIKNPDGSRMQVKFEEGIPVAAMTFKGDTAISSVLFVSNKNKLKYMKITYYDANGNAILTSTHKIDESFARRLLSVETLNAQTGCWALAGSMTLTASAVTLLTIEIATAVSSGNLVLAAALRVKLASAVASAALASTAWWNCSHTSTLSNGASGGGGGGGFTSDGTRETTTVGTAQGGCYTVLHTLYSTSTGLIVSQWQEQICK